MSVGPMTEWWSSPSMLDLVDMAERKGITWPAAKAVSEHLGDNWSAIITITGPAPCARPRPGRVVIWGDEGTYVVSYKRTVSGQMKVVGSHDLSRPQATVKIEPRRRP